MDESNQFLPVTGASAPATQSDRGPRFLPAIIFAGGLALVALHLFHFPSYRIDTLNYMANIKVLETTDPVELHAAVYGALAGVPAEARSHLLGLDGQGTPQQSAMLKDRAVNPGHFVELLPCFAIRPLYIELLHIIRKFGFGLFKTTVLGSVLPFYALGILVFIWSRHYTSGPRAMILSFLLLIAPVSLLLGRCGEPDCLSVLWTGCALYLLFEREHSFPGLVFLLSSVFVRTDNVLLVLIVLAYLWLVARQLDIFKAGALGLLAVSSVLFINHFAGDYGWKMMYYRGFIAAPIAPGEFTASFSFAHYMQALRRGITEALAGPLIPYFLLGTIGYLAPTGQRLRKIVLITVVFTAVHFVIFPLVEDRYFGLYYMVMGLSAISAAGNLDKEIPRLRFRRSSAGPQEAAA